MGTREAVEAFVQAINSGDVDAIWAHMTQDHVFIDSLGNRVAGRDAVAAGWRAYLRMFPDYRLSIQSLMSEGSVVLLCGSAHGTFHPGDMLAHGSEVTLYAAWRAIVETDKIALWQVYADNKVVYDLLAC